MAKNKISEYSSVAANNVDIGGINIAEGCAPSGINNAIRELMAQLKDQQAGTDGDGFIVGGAFTSSGGAVFSSGTTFSSSVVMSSTVAMNGNNNIGNTTSSTILSGTVTQTTASKLYLDDSVTTSAAPPLSWDGDTDTGVYRPAANTMALVTAGVDRLRVNSTGVVIIGSGEATTSVAGNILRSPNATGTNITGANFEINAGNGTGTGGSGNIIFKTADVGSSGSTANTMTQRLLITKKGGFSFGSNATNFGVAGQVLKSNGDAPPSFSDLSVTPNVVCANTGGDQSFSVATWTTAELSTKILDTLSVTLSNNTLTLPAGTYYFELSTPIRSTGSDSITNAQNALWTAAGAVVSNGGVSQVGDWSTSFVTGVGTFTLTESTDIVVKVFASDSPTPRIDGVSGYTSTILKIWKTA